MPEIKELDMPDIRGFLSSTLNEWRGKIAAVIFLSGCNLRCPFCHGWRFVKDWQNMPEIEIDEIEASLSSNDGWIDGVVVSGGEPTLHHDLENLIDWLRAKGLKIKLHTNGTHPEVVERLLKSGKLDCLALDFKGPLTDEGLTKSGGVKVDAEKVRKSFTLAGESGIEAEMHTTLCPAVLGLDQLSGMAEDLKKLVPQARWLWQQYNTEDVLDSAAAGKEQFSYDEITEKAEEIEVIFPEIEIRGF